MVAHQDERIAEPAEVRRYLPQLREKPFPVLLVHEDRVALVPAGGEVPDGARNLRPEGSAHPAAISQC